MTVEPTPPKRPEPATPGRSDVVSVGYSRTFTRVLLVAGAVVLVGGALILRAGAGYVGFIGFGVLLIVLGLLYRKRTYFTFEPASHTITTWAPIGPAHRPYWLSPGSRLGMSGNRIVANLPGGNSTKIPVHRYLADHDDWNTVVSHVADPG